MGFFNNLLNAIRRLDQRTSSLTFQQFGQAPVYPDGKVETFIKDAYCGNASVFSIVNMAARKFSFIPRYVMQIEDEEAVKQYKRLERRYTDIGARYKIEKIKKKAYNQEVSGKGAAALEKLLKRPNEREGQDAFFFGVYVSYKIAGEAFIWLNRGDVKYTTDEFGNFVDDGSIDKLPVLEMFLLPPYLVEIIPTKEDVWGIEKYQINLNGRMVDIRKNDIIHWKTFNPTFDTFTREHLRGLAPLNAGNKILTMDEDSTDAAVAMYQNGGARGILAEKSLRNITPTQKAALEEITAKRINNKDLKSSIANIQGDWVYLDIGKDSVDMQLLDGNDKAFAKLCHLFGVPPGLFLIDQTYENQRSNRKRMLSELIIPDCASFNDEMNRALLPAFGLKRDTIEPDYSELPEMQEDMKDMIEYLKDSPITPNEFRDALGYEMITQEGMDVVYMDSNKTEVGMDIQIAPKQDF